MPDNECEVICCKIYKLKEDVDQVDLTKEENFDLLKETVLYSNSGDYQYKYRHILNKMLQYVPVELYTVEKTFFEWQEDYFNNNEVDKSKYNDPKDFTYIYYYLKKVPGCEHYARGCHIQCNICKDFFPCRFCHDEGDTGHDFPRYQTEMVKCNACGHVQSIGKCECEDCGERFGRYCHKCRLYDNLPDEGKPIFHCDGCGMCRVGL